MDIQVDPTLLVVNLDNCINSDATRQIVKGGGCMYTVAVATNDDTTMVQIPVSVHCTGDVQSAFGVLPQLQEHSNSQGHHQYRHTESEQYTQIPGDLQCLVSTNNQVDNKEPSSNNPENQSEVIAQHQTSLDINTMYYNDIFNYLTNNTMPEGATASHKLLLKKRAKNYSVKDGILFYGHSKPKKVITDREEQLKILQDIHIEKETGIHLGVKKMYSAVNASCFWRGQYMDVANHVRQCNKCTEAGETRLGSLQEQYLEGKSSQNETTKGLLAEKTSGVWEKVEMAVYGPYSKTENENEFLVTLIDPVSQWIVAQPIPKENIPSHLISFVQHTFCLFGFAKCHVVRLSDDLKEVVQTLYKQQEASMQQFLSKFDLLSDTLLKDSIFVFSENDDECLWLNSLIKTFVNNHPTTWDSELMKFVFELNISKRGTAQTPFSKMFSRNPISFFSENKENAAVHFHNKENDVNVVSKRRRLQSSILQCRHCEEIFTSKISFRIHQRKHTEEARRRGILDGEDPIKIVSNRERRLLKRPMGLKQKRLLLKQGSADQEDSHGTCIGQSGLEPASQVDVSDGRRAELRANTVAAVRRLLATTRDSRKRRGKYMKFPTEIQEEMARYAIDNGSLMTVRHFSSKLGVVISESTIRNIVKWYQCYTPEVKEEIGRYAAAYGVDAAVTHFSERLGREVRHGLIRKFRKLYLLRYPEFKRQCMKNKASRGRIIKGSEYSNSVNKSKKCVYSAELKEEIGLYACNHSIPATIAYFSEKLNITLKQHVVRRCRKLYMDKQRAALQEQQQLINEQQEQHHNNSLLPQQSHGPVPNHHESSGPSHSQTIDILQTSLNLLNNSQLNSSSAVVYNHYQSAPLSHLQPSSSLIPVNHQQNPPLAFHSIDHCNSSTNVSSSIPLTYHQSHVPISASVIMNQNVAAVQTFQQTQVYSPFNHQNESVQTASVAVSNNASIPLAITQPSSHHTSISHHPEHSQPSSLSTVALAVASAHSDDNFQHQPSDPATVVVSQGVTQHPIFVSHPQGTTALVQHFIASQSSMQASETPVSHHLLNGTHSTTENPQGFSQVLEHSEINSDTFSQTLNNENNIDSVPFESSDSVLIEDRREAYIVQSDISAEAARVKKEFERVHVHHLSEPDNSDITETVVTDQDPLELRNSHQGSKQISSPEADQEVNTEQEHANITNIVTDCPVESNFQCKEIKGELNRTPNSSKKKSLPKRGGRKKGSGKGSSRRPIGQKRGSYTTYSPEIRAEMGKYAAEHGSQRACFYFRAKLGREVAESTMRGLRDKYLKKRESFSAGSDSNCDKEVTSLGYAPRGRPMRLGKYDEVVQECIHDLVRSGEKVSSYLAITTAKQVLMQYEPHLLEENGGSIKLNITWAKSFLKRIGIKNYS
ncbi:uncharacterized protein [Anabrus simplex]|uniref:uncharacterized protein n=1 Tax=Anabrus simplex TaxID=316456 RepID=UPI0035A37E1C